MEHNWRKIVTEIYPKVDPIGGFLFTSIGKSFIHDRKIKNLWMEFHIKGFKYIDPWDGETGPYPKYHMSLEPNLNQCYIKLNSIKDLEKLEIQPDKTDKIGCFSNSLDFVVHKLEFGEITNGEIDVKFTYSFTNNFGYGNMDGTIEDHITEKGEFKTKLKIREIQVAVPNEIDPTEIIQHLNNEVYDIENFRIGKVPEDLSWTAPHSKGYIVPYK